MIEIGPSASFDEKAHTYFYRGKRIPSFSWVMRVCGMVNYYGSSSDFAMKRGTAVHRACELLVKGTLDPATVDPRIIGYVEAFKRACEELGFTPDPALVEKPMVNPVYLFGVKPDCPGRFKDWGIGIIELKTGHIPKTARLQTAAQTLTLWPNSWMTARRMAVELKEDGTWAKQEHENPDDADEFLTHLGSAVAKLNDNYIQFDEEG